MNWLPGQHRGQHRAGTSLLILAVCLLAVGALAFVYARADRAVARQAVSMAEQAQAVARAGRASAEINRALMESAERLRQRAGMAGISPQAWGERHVNLRQQNLTRGDANQALVGIARHAGQVMKLEEFELSVTQADEGLFDMPSTARQPVLLTLRGMMYFRLGQ